MGQHSSNPYQSKEAKIFQKFGAIFSGENKNITKRDGTILRSKQEIIEDYDNSNLPYPLKPILKLDYCWRLTYTMYKHSLYLGIPLTTVYFLWKNIPHCWNYTLKTAPYRQIFKNYIVVVVLINAVNTIWSLGFEDYCQRHSRIYDTKRNAQELRKLIRDTNKDHAKTVTGEAHKTLTEDEILNDLRDKTKKSNIL